MILAILYNAYHTRSGNPSRVHLSWLWFFQTDSGVLLDFFIVWISVRKYGLQKH